MAKNFSPMIIIAKFFANNNLIFSSVIIMGLTFIAVIIQLCYPLRSDKPN